MPEILGYVAGPSSNGSVTFTDITASVSSTFGDGSTDATSHIQAKIDATPPGGVLYISKGLYKLTSALTISSHISIEGLSLCETYTSKTAGGSLNHPTTSPFLLGAVLQQTTAATDVIKITGSAKSVHLKNLGLNFAAAIDDTNTGHGVNAATSQAYLSGSDSGPMSFRWENVVVAGHDGNHYAFRILNGLYGSLTHLRSYGGGVLSVECDSYGGNYGNMTVEHLYGELYNAGTASGVNLSGRVTASASAGVLNLLTFNRPQINITGAAATAGTQLYFDSGGGAGLADAVLLVAPDFEGAGANTVDFGGVNGGTRVVLGGILNALPAAGFDRVGQSYQKFTATGTFKVPNGVTKLRVRCIGGGGGGGGAGSALSSGGTSTQAGAGGGGAGMVTDTMLTVTPNLTYDVTCGAGGAGGAGGAVNSNAGSNGSAGARSQFGTSGARADGGGGGIASAANSTTTVGGGLFGNSSNTTNTRIPGVGGTGTSSSGLAASAMPPGVVGGGGGAGATATNGGGRGTSATVDEPAYFTAGGGSSGASGTATGVDGQTATTPGCGGGGGGGGAPTGAGGTGGTGATGTVEVWW